MEPGDIHRLELIALESNMRREILDFIGFELKRLKEIGEAMGVDDKELENHISTLEEALLVEREGDCCKLTPRCKAYLDQRSGYEWAR
jgi:predicted transcriptional regulator